MKENKKNYNETNANERKGKNIGILILVSLCVLVLGILGIFLLSGGNAGESEPKPPTPGIEDTLTPTAIPQNTLSPVPGTPSPTQEVTPTNEPATPKPSNAPEVSEEPEPTEEISGTPTEELSGTPTAELSPTDGAGETPTPTKTPAATGKPTVTPPKTPTPTKKPVSTPTPAPSAQAKYVYVIEATKLNENPQYYTPGKQCDVAHGTKLESLGKVGSGYYTKVRYNGGIWYVPTENIGNAYLSPTPTIAVGAYLSKEMLTLVNAARAEEGLRPYSWGADLEALALKRATHLYTVAQTEEFQNGDYETQRKLGHSGSWSGGGEIMHIGYDSSAADALYGWKVSSHNHWHLIIQNGTEDVTIGTEPDGSPITVYDEQGNAYHTGDVKPGTPIRMAAAYYVDKYGDTYWVLVTAREGVQYNP